MLKRVVGKIGTDEYWDRPDDEVEADEYARGWNAAIEDTIPDDGRFWTGCTSEFITGAFDAVYELKLKDREHYFTD